jgi:hypothetical protein
MCSSHITYFSACHLHCIIFADLLALARSVILVRVYFLYQESREFDFGAKGLVWSS